MEGLGPTSAEQLQSVHDFVVARMREKILRGAWKPGEPIRQEAAATEFGVSRVPVREALKTLEAEGSVVYLPRRGFVVPVVDQEALAEIHHIRTLLEDEAVKLAVPRLDHEAIERMRKAMLDMEARDRGDLEGLRAANRRFHFSLLELSGMPRLVRFIRILWDNSGAYANVLYSDEEALQEVFKEHRALLDACIARDVQAAIRIHSEHRKSAREGIRRIMESRERQANEN